MTSRKEIDYEHANLAGNGPKERMEGGDETDDIFINDPDEREKQIKAIKRRKRDIRISNTSV